MLYCYNDITCPVLHEIRKIWHTEYEKRRYGIRTGTYNDHKDCHLVIKRRKDMTSTSKPIPT